jgi:hypothetical protein
MTNSGNLSIILPAYNAESTIGTTLDSTVALVDAGAELVIIDDGIEWRQGFKNQSDSIHHPIYKKLSESLNDLGDKTSHSNLKKMYEGGFKWEYRLLRLIHSNQSIQQNFKINNISLVEWDKENPYALVEFDFQMNPKSKIYRVRQYWMASKNDWLIVNESIF